MRSADIIIIGGGLIGLATAYEFLRAYPNKSLLLLEKEYTLADHQSSRNSGIVHSGIFYKPNSKKAELTRTGRDLLKQYCAENHVPLSPRTKLIVAIDESELVDLQTLYQQGQTNGVACRLISPNRIRDLEPHATGVAAIEVDDVYAVDYASSHFGWPKVCANWVAPSSPITKLQACVRRLKASLYKPKKRLFWPNTLSTRRGCTPTASPKRAGLSYPF